MLDPKRIGLLIFIPQFSFSKAIAPLRNCFPLSKVGLNETLSIVF